MLEGAEFLLRFGLVIEIPKKLAPLVGANLGDRGRQVFEDPFDCLVVDLRRLNLLKDLYWSACGCGSVFECLPTFSCLLCFTSLRFQKRSLPARVFLNLVGQEIVSVNIDLLLRGLLGQAFRVVGDLQRRLLRASDAHRAQELLKVKGTSRWYAITSLFLNELVNTILICFRKVLLRCRSARLSGFHFKLLIINQFKIKI